MKQTIYIPVKAEDELPLEREELHLINNGLFTTGFYQDGQWYLGEHETPVLSFKGEWLKPVEITEEEIRQEINKHLFPASEYEQDALLEWDQAAKKCSKAILTKLNREP